MTINAFQFEASIKALPLPKSKGKKISRLHLFDYTGKTGQDRYAVACKKFLNPSKSPKLGWLDKKFYVLHAHHDEMGATTWFKINKNSLQKRLNISDKVLKTFVDPKTGLTQNFETLLQQNSMSAKVFNAQRKCRTPLDAFSASFTAALVNTGTLGAYKAILFCKDDGIQIFGNPSVTDLYFGDETDINPNNVRHFPSGSILMIYETDKPNLNLNYISQFGSKFQNFYINNLKQKDIVNTVKIPISFKKDFVKSQKIDKKLLANINNQDREIIKFEEECKNALKVIKEKPEEICIVMTTPSKHITLNSKVGNLPDLCQEAKAFASDEERETKSYFPPQESTATLIARYADKYLIVSLEKNGSTSWRRVQSLNGDPSNSVLSSLKNINQDSAPFAHFFQTPLKNPQIPQ